jgi:hypothetical protein
MVLYRMVVMIIDQIREGGGRLQVRYLSLQTFGGWEKVIKTEGKIYTLLQL